MLRIGFNNYDIVDAHSHLSVTLYPLGDSVGGRQQVWQLKANFAPGEVDYSPPTPWTDEYLELFLRPEFYQVQDWRKLSGFNLGHEEDDGLVLATLTNRLAEGSDPRELAMTVDDLKLEFDDDFVFRFHLDGVHKLPDGTEQELKVREMLSFKEVVAYVPINSADPVTTAKAMAAKSINLMEFSEHRVTPYDPSRPTRLKSKINSHHIVTLQTAWR
jgi:hypothetical protein